MISSESLSFEKTVSVSSLKRQSSGEGLSRLRHGKGHSLNRCPSLNLLNEWHFKFRPRCSHITETSYSVCCLKQNGAVTPPQVWRLGFFWIWMSRPLSLCHPRGDNSGNFLKLRCVRTCDCIRFGITPFMWKGLMWRNYRQLSVIYCKVLFLLWIKW